MHQEIKQAFRMRGMPLLGQTEPLTSYHASGDPLEIQAGQKLLKAGKVGCIVLAGGQGTRLNWPGPKGTFPLTRVRRKSLFQVLCERRKAASLLYGQSLPLAVMTSPRNDLETREALECEADFFPQEMVPFLDEKGELLGVEGPSGNGDALRYFYESGLWKKWKDAGVEFVQLIPIDNVLADPYDANLVGFHALSGAEVTLKAILRERADEQVGVMGSARGKLRVIEYFELPEDEKAAMQGELLKWRVANLTLFCFSMEFIKGVQGVSLPWHFALKQGFYKPERFIFDILDYTDLARAIVYPREETFAPLKNASGENSPETVRAALLAYDRKRFAAVAGEYFEELFELDPAFYYPTPELIKKWRNGRPTGAYIEP